MRPIQWALALVTLSLYAGALVDGFQVSKESVEKLCQEKGKSDIVISRLSEVNAVIESLNNNRTIVCNREVKEAILDLEQFFRLPDVCSRKAADTIVRFWKAHMQKKDKSKLPHSLREFFHAFALQVSKVCKTKMMDELDKVNDTYGISETDVQAVTWAIKASKKLETMFGKEPKLESLMTVVQTDPANMDDWLHRRGIGLTPMQKAAFDMTKKRCDNKFKPVYNSFISPTVRLASIGLDYSGSSMDAKMDNFRKSPTWQDWFNVIFTCEPMAGYEGFEIEQTKRDSKGKKYKTIVMDFEDFEELKKLTGLKQIFHKEDIEPIIYKVDAKLDDLVLDESDEQLTNSMANHEKKLEEINQFSSKLFKVVRKSIKSMLKDERIQFGLKPLQHVGGPSRLTKYRMKIMAKLGTFLKYAGYVILAPLFAILFVIALFVRVSQPYPMVSGPARGPF